MQCTVIVRPESATCFVACPVGLPQLESSAPTAAEAVEQVKQKLSLWLKDAEVVEVSIPTGNLWLDTFGRSSFRLSKNEKKEFLWKPSKRDLSLEKTDGCG